MSSSSSSSLKSPSFPIGVCVKAASLRPSYPDLRTWAETPGNILVVRQGRIFINKQIFHYPSSPWANPFKLSEFTLDECLRRFELHLVEKLEDQAVRREFVKLREAREIGCFCDKKDRCHRDVILKILRKCLAEDEGREEGEEETKRKEEKDKDKDLKGKGKEKEKEEKDSSEKGSEDLEKAQRKRKELQSQPLDEQEKARRKQKSTEG